jgi:hypothetical protein
MTDMLQALNATDWRTIPGWPGYVINSGPNRLEVWSLPREVPAKGGSTRMIKGKQLTPTTDGRVILSRPGVKAQVLHVAHHLHPITFPDLIEQERRDRAGQAWCRKGHPLMRASHPILAQWFRYDDCHRLADVEPRMVHWGTNHRICLWCWPDAGDFDECTYSAEWGTNRMPDHQTSSVPTTPRLKPSHDYDVDEEGQLLLNQYGLFTDNQVALEWTDSLGSGPADSAMVITYTE